MPPGAAERAARTRAKGGSLQRPASPTAATARVGAPPPPLLGLLLASVLSTTLGAMGASPRDPIAACAPQSISGSKRPRSGGGPPLPPPPPGPAAEVATRAPTPTASPCLARAARSPAARPAARRRVGASAAAFFDAFGAKDGGLLRRRLHGRKGTMAAEGLVERPAARLGERARCFCRRRRCCHALSRRDDFARRRTARPGPPRWVRQRHSHAGAPGDDELAHPFIVCQLLRPLSHHPLVCHAPVHAVELGLAAAAVPPAKSAPRRCRHAAGAAKILLEALEVGVLQRLHRRHVFHGLHLQNALRARKRRWEEGGGGEVRMRAGRAPRLREVHRAL